MTQNLRLGGDSPITLTSEDTDITSNYILPKSSNSGWTFHSNGPPLRANLYIDETYGGYYTFLVATAGTSSWDQATSKTENTYSQSICPKKWDLPTKDNADELVRYYDTNSIQSYPAKFVLGGQSYQEGSWSREYANCGIYRLSTSRYQPYHLKLGGCGYGTDYGWNGANAGSSVRCLRSDA